MKVTQALWGEASEKFYEWEVATKQVDLSDKDRIMWCEGYINAMSQAGILFRHAAKHRHVNFG